MSRELIAEEELVRRINAAIVEVPAIVACNVSGVYELRDCDENGCNWSVGYFSSGTIPADISRPLVESVILDMQSKYNIQSTNAAPVDKQVNASDACAVEPKRSLYLSFLVDANCVNARQRMVGMNRLERWADEGLIDLLTVETAQTEMVAGNNDARRAKAYEFIYTMSAITSPEEQTTMQEVEEAIFPEGARTQSEKNDV